MRGYERWTGSEVRRLGKAGSSLAAKGWLVAVVGALVVMAISACGLGTGSSASGGKVEVVAVENFWGSIATQVGGDHAHVTSVIVNPATDPHDYEPTPADAKLIAAAKYVIVNGAGYDSWAPKLLAANPMPSRIVLAVSNFTAQKRGAHPHMCQCHQYIQQVSVRN